MAVTVDAVATALGGAALGVAVVAMTVVLHHRGRASATELGHQRPLWALLRLLVWGSVVLALGTGSLWALSYWETGSGDPEPCAEAVDGLGAPMSNCARDWSWESTACQDALLAIAAAAVVLTAATGIARQVERRITGEARAGVPR